MYLLKRFSKGQFVKDKANFTNCSRRVNHLKLAVIHTTKSHDVYQLELSCVSSLVGITGLINIWAAAALLITLRNVGRPAGDLTCPAPAAYVFVHTSSSATSIKRNIWTSPYFQLNLKRTIGEN